jgi:hypothetical protein
MAFTDFLFQGAPPPSVTTYGETTTSVPAWYSDYTQGLISRANAIAAEPYQAYGYQRIADLDAAQNTAYNKAKGLESQYSPLMGQAQQNIQASTGSTLGAAQPYINTALGYNPYTTAQPMLGEAGNLLRQQVGDTSALAQPYFQQAGQLTNQGTQSAAGLATPYFQQAGQLTNQGTQSAAGLATPYFQQAGQLTNQGAQTGLGNIQDYMNPYTDQVVNRIGELGARNLKENLLPNIQDRAIQAGTFGGSRSGEAIGRALRDTQESTLAQQSAALQQGYGQAGQLLQADRGRQLQAAQQQAAMGQSAAGLTAADYQRMLAGAQQQAAMGQSAAGLTAADYQRMLAGAQQQAAMGQAAAGLEGADLGRYGQAGAQIGALGQMQGQLAGQAGAQNLQAAQQVGALSSQDFARMLQSGQALGALGQQTQQMGMQNIAGLEAAGATQQQQSQRSLDQAYQDFLNQRDYGRGNTAYLNAAIRGLQVPTSTTTESSGPASVYQPSPLAQFGSTLASGYGLSKLFGGKT